MGSSGSTVSSDIACNGNAALCSRSWSNVTLIGTHDSAFVGIWPTDNQADTVTQQLDAGIRFLQAQTHSKSGVLELCHTSCTELDAGPVTSYLSTIKTWMDGNPNQVVTLLLTNGDSVDVSEFGTAMETTGLSSYAYTPPSQLSIDEWPTLQELIDDGTRLVMFLGKYFYIVPIHVTHSSQITVQTLQRFPTSWTSSHISSRLHTMSLTVPFHLAPSIVPLDHLELVL
jgi:hypothetical protein